MKNAVAEFIEPTDQEKKELWNTAVFVFDTNVLLNLYRYSAKTRNSLLAAFESFKDRIWIPYQVAYEYMNKRCEVIFETIQRYDSFRKEIDNFSNKAVETLRLTTNDEEKVELQKYLFKWLDSNKDRNLLVLDAEKDEILEKLLAIFEGKVGERITESELNSIKEEGEKRYQKCIPPGYKDEKKKCSQENDNNAYGDFIIWKQIMNFAAEKEKGIVYVTHDQKEDWWNIVKGKTIGPRIELRREFKEKTKQEFHMYSMNSFISTYNKMNKNSLDKSVVNEVINLDISEKKNKKSSKNRSEISISEKITRIEDTIEKINNRIIRREKVVSDIDNKYQNKKNEIPENIQMQYDNTMLKIEELRNARTEKEKELEVLRQALETGSVIFSW